MIRNALFLFLFTFFLLAVFIPSYSQMQDLRSRNNELQAQIEQLKAKNADLAQEKHWLEEDPVYLERVAREKMGLAKEGEVVYRLMPEETSK
jgi:cell division protein FtsB